MATSTLLTIDDFERLPAEMAENHELVNGELVDVSGNTPRHNLLRDFLVALLLPFVQLHKLGTIVAEQEYDFLGNAHGPDVSFVLAVKEHLLDLDLRVQRFVPDLAIEIASKRDTYDELLEKKQRYLDAGTREVWLLSTRTREVTVFPQGRVLRGTDKLETVLIPGFAITVEELFDKKKR
jgi:Uma2 family endonuclease